MADISESKVVSIIRQMCRPDFMSNTVLIHPSFMEDLSNQYEINTLEILGNPTGFSIFNGFYVFSTQQMELIYAAITAKIDEAPAP